MVTIEDLENDFEGHPESPWNEERKFAETLFKEPPVSLAALIFGGYSSFQLPYWDMKADAKRHAMKHVKEGIEPPYIAEDYLKAIWTPSKDFLLGYGIFEIYMKGLIDTLPNGPSGKMPYPQLIRRRFGFAGKPEPIEVVAKGAELTRERVRDLENTAFRIMRHPSRSSAIKDYLETQRWAFMKYLRSTGYL